MQFTMFSLVLSLGICLLLGVYPMHLEGTTKHKRDQHFLRHKSTCPIFFSMFHMLCFLVVLSCISFICIRICPLNSVLCSTPYLVYSNHRPMQCIYLPPKLLVGHQSLVAVTSGDNGTNLCDSPSASWPAAPHPLPRPSASLPTPFIPLTTAASRCSLNLHPESAGQA